MKGNKVIIKSRPRESALKIHEWKSEGGKPLNKNKVMPKLKDGFSPLYSSSIAGLQTGLTGKVKNPYKDTSVDVLGPVWKYLNGLEEITLQEKLEYKHGRAPGFYTNKMPKEKDPATYLSDIKWKFNDGSTILDLNVPDNELCYYWCLATKYVANSKKDLDEHRFPHALFYIAVDGEDEDVEKSSNSLKNKAALKLESDVMTDENMVNIAKALSWFIGQSNTALYNDITNKISNTTPSKMRTADNDVALFTKTASLLDTDTGRAELAARALLFDLTKARIITESKGTYTWASHGMGIGFSKDDAVSFLTDPNKEDAIKSMRLELAASILR
jgi:hypothetical protein